MTHAAKRLNLKIFEIKMKVKDMPVACISGDVHHYRDQYMFAEEYAKILDKEGVTGTLFVTGKCVEQYPSTFLEIKEIVELGGHTYSAFQPWILHRLFKRLYKSLYGPRLYQNLDIKRTIHAFQSQLGVRIRVWRTHWYAGDKNTYQVLDNLGFLAVSDDREIGSFKIKREGQHLYHVTITSPLDDHIKISEDNSEWKRNYIEFLIAQIKRKSHIVFQMHPMKMKFLDNFELLRFVIRKLLESNYEFYALSRLVKTLARRELMV